jgi:hypothetical protein
MVPSIDIDTPEPAVGEPLKIGHVEAHAPLHVLWLAGSEVRPYRVLPPDTSTVPYWLVSVCTETEAPAGAEAEVVVVDDEVLAELLHDAAKVAASPTTRRDSSLWIMPKYAPVPLPEGA